MSEYIPLGENELVYPGDTIRLHFKTVGMVWLAATQIALIEKRFADKHPEYKIWSREYTKDSLTFTIEIREKPNVLPEMQKAGVHWAAIATMVASLSAFGIVYFLSTGAEKMKPAVTIFSAATLLGAAAALFVALKAGKAK